MEARLLLLLLAVSISPAWSLQYKINHTWNGTEIDHLPVNITITGNTDGTKVELKIEAPFLNDPPPPNTTVGPTIEGLYKYEVVEAYFLNDEEERYMMIQMNPGGYHCIYLLDGYYQKKPKCLQAETYIEIKGNKWIGSAKIPADFFPRNVTKFNAYAVQGTGNQSERTHLSLYPAPASEPKPDFHVLKYFKSIDLSKILPNNDLQQWSKIWQDFLEGSLNYAITKTWNGDDINHSPIQLTVRRNPEKNLVLLSIKSRFFNDSGVPSTPQWKPTRLLYKYEVVEAYFANDDDQYLEIQVSPYGQYCAFLFNGYRMRISNCLKLWVNSYIDGDSWRAIVEIPSEYFPKNVTKFNAFGIHGPEEARIYESLYPADASAVEPDFHALKYFGESDLSTIWPEQNANPMSQLWLDYIKNSINYEMKHTWNGGDIDHRPISIKLSGGMIGTDIKLSIEAPFFNDPAPADHHNRTLYDIWRYEVVEVFFLNNDDHYLQVQINPWGYYCASLYHGFRQRSADCFEFRVTTERKGDTWTAFARIPLEYLPRNVSKFNAHSIHGQPKEDRIYESLYPAPSDALRPEFHALENFREIDLNKLFLIDVDLDHQSQVWKDFLEQSLEYKITKTWNNNPVDHSPIEIQLRKRTNANVLDLSIKAPFFNDTVERSCLPDQPCFYLYDYEVVEVYFANDDGYYLQIQVSPYGQYCAYLFNGYRVRIRNCLGLFVRTHVTERLWRGSIRVPIDYFPHNVTKFNAFGMHGEGENRAHLSLYRNGVDATKADFHVLQDFKNIDLSKIWHEEKNRPMSKVWSEALDGSLNFEVKHNWNGSDIDHMPISVKITGSVNRTSVLLSIEAPFFNDSAPADHHKRTLYDVWKYEVVEVFFLNDDDEYLQVQINPWGYYCASLWHGFRQRSPDCYEFKVTTERKGATWTASAEIPQEYLPSNVTKINAFGMHGLDKDRHYESLYPAPADEPKPDFHVLDYFKNIDFEKVLPKQQFRGVSKIWNDFLGKSLQYSITRTWNGSEINHSPIKLILRKRVKDSINLSIKAPFFNDPKNTQNNSYDSIWKQEAVEVYFLNDDGYYLQIQVTPNGQSCALLFREERVEIDGCLPLEVNSSIKSGHWRAIVKIPLDYFPPNVTRFNAHAMHGSAENRVYESLYPAEPAALKIDFHNLKYFGDIDLASIWSEKETHSLSQVWADALASILDYKITTSWNGVKIDHSPVHLIMGATSDEKILRLRIIAPFFNDPIPPKNISRGPTFKIQEYFEEIEVYFLNDENQYLQIQLSSEGQYCAILHKAERIPLKLCLPLTVYTSKRGDESWMGIVLIPVEYLPKNVSKFNAAAIHLSGENKHYESLYPAPSNTETPDFHALQYFKGIDLSRVLPSHKDAEMSDLWDKSLQSMLDYKITTSWNGGNIDHSPVQLFLNATSDDKFLKLSIIAPLFNDPVPPKNISRGPTFKIQKNFEEIEVYFLNDDNQYLQIQLSSEGHYCALLHSAEREPIRYCLPLTVHTRKRFWTWRGRVIIPVEYLPKNVSKFNAAAIHLSGEKKHYESLYPAPSNTETPDFHALKYFKGIDLSPVLPSHKEAEMSELWLDSLKGIFKYKIEKTWNGLPVKNKPAEITLQQNTEGIQMNITAPYLNDTASSGTSSKPSYTLKLYKAIEMLFSNEEGEIFQVVLTPGGDHIILFLNKPHQSIKHSLSLNYTVLHKTQPSEGQPGEWKGTALLPLSYFPANVTKLNAFVLLKTNQEDLEYQALYPAPLDDSEYTEPDIYRVELFKPKDAMLKLPKTYSKVWQKLVSSYEAKEKATNKPVLPSVYNKIKSV